LSITELLIIVKRQKQPKCSSKDKQNVEDTYNKIFFSLRKEENSVTTWRKLEHNNQGEIHLTQKDKYCKILLM
jgi:hypothetical protein